MEIKKWQVYLADLNPRFGTEPGKLRPVVVVQTNLLNDTEHPSTLICPITTKIIPKVEILRIPLKKNEAGLHAASAVLIDQLRAIDNRRLKKILGTVEKENRLRILHSLKIIMDL